MNLLDNNSFKIKVNVKLAVWRDPLDFIIFEVFTILKITIQNISINCFF